MENSIILYNNEETGINIVKGNVGDYSLYEIENEYGEKKYIPAFPVENLSSKTRYNEEDLVTTYSYIIDAIHSNFEYDVDFKKVSVVLEYLLEEYSIDVINSTIEELKDYMIFDMFNVNSKMSNNSVINIFIKALNDPEFELNNINEYIDEKPKETVNVDYDPTQGFNQELIEEEKKPEVILEKIKTVENEILSLEKIKEYEFNNLYKIDDMLSKNSIKIVSNKLDSVKELEDLLESITSLDKKENKNEEVHYIRENRGNYLINLINFAVKYNYITESYANILLEELQDAIKIYLKEYAEQNILDEYDDVENIINKKTDETIRVKLNRYLESFKPYDALMEICKKDLYLLLNEVNKYNINESNSIGSLLDEVVFNSQYLYRNLIQYKTFIDSLKENIKNQDRKFKEENFYELMGLFDEITQEDHINDIYDYKRKHIYNVLSHGEGVLSIEDIKHILESIKIENSIIGRFKYDDVRRIVELFNANLLNDDIYNVDNTIGINGNCGNINICRIILTNYFYSSLYENLLNDYSKLYLPKKIDEFLFIDIVSNSIFKEDFMDVLENGIIEFSKTEKEYIISNYFDRLYYADTNLYEANRLVNEQPKVRKK